MPHVVHAHLLICNPSGVLLIYVTCVTLSLVGGSLRMWCRGVPFQDFGVCESNFMKKGKLLKI
jgi:hypothetical protein